MRKTADNRLRTVYSYNMQLQEWVDFDEQGYPMLRYTETIPDEFVAFSALTSADMELKERSACHFYIDDYRFERIWTRPDRYLRMLGECKCVIQPDYSLYVDMPEPVQRWNKYRQNLMAAYWASQGLDVIPNLRWAWENSYEFCFNGIPEGTVVAASTIGCMKDPEMRDMWHKGMRAAIERIHPQAILLYGKEPDIDWGDILVIRYRNDAVERLRKLKRKGE